MNKPIEQDAVQLARDVMDPDVEIKSGIEAAEALAEAILASRGEAS